MQGKLTSIPEIKTPEYNANTWQAERCGEYGKNIKQHNVN